VGGEWSGGLRGGRWAGAAGGPPPPPPAAPSPPLPPLQTQPLANLVAAAGVRWALFATPRDLLAIPWLPRLVDVAVSGARFDRFATSTGIDLRGLADAIVVSYAPAGDSKDDVMLYLTHHGGDAQGIERSFRTRFTSGEKRSVDRPDLVRVSGKVGRETQAAVFLGRDVVGFQEGGSASRGPARVAALFAEGKLKRAHSVLAGEPLRSLAARLGAAPLAAYAPGPFEGDVARGLRGLLGAATALGAVARPSAREGLAITLAVTGDFSTSGPAAASELLAAWNELAASRFGHLLGLDAPLDPPAVTHSSDAVGLAVELSAKTLAEGLAQATATRVQDIFK
jgi:hypothetical protein